jgi:hypothetical protein
VKVWRDEPDPHARPQLTRVRPTVRRRRQAHERLEDLAAGWWWLTAGIWILIWIFGGPSLVAGVSAAILGLTGLVLWRTRR